MRAFTGVKIHKLNLSVVNVVERGTELVNLRALFLSWSHCQ